MGTIDESALQSLSLIVNLSKQIQIKSSGPEGECEDPDELARYFPSFMWTVRDFTLRLIDTFGNPISSKEYLEQALKQVKGSSEAVENKNRVRRLITSFFQDRDCFTMVRPTENEKDLQHLQKLSDQSMRPEFLNQMGQLRSRIFKRVKPKSLNGRFITGATLLELCEAYTTAINQGTVPCIESAWTYVCRNENQRAQLESINLYKQELGALLAQEAVSSQDLKETHLELQTQSLRFFREKAIGDELDQFEAEVIKAIRHEYNLVKQRCASENKKFCEEAIKKDLDEFYADTRVNKYKTEVELHQRVDILKTIFQETLASVHYKDKDAFIDKTHLAMINAGLKSLLTQAKMASKDENLLLKNKVEMLEQDLKQNKAEAREEKRYLQEQSDKIMAESRTQEVLLLKKLEDEKEKVKEAEQRHHSAHKDREKNDALQKQRIQFLERDMKGLQDLVDQSETTIQDLRDRLGESERSRQSFLSKTEESNKEEIEQVRAQYEAEISQLKDQKAAELSHLEQKLSQAQTEADKAAQSQLWEQKEQQMRADMEANKKQQQEEMLQMQQNLMQAIQSQKQEKERDNDTKSVDEERQRELIETNKTLSNTIAQVEERNKALTQKVSTVKIYQRVFKHSVSMQCKFCHVFYPAESFIEHVKTCTKDSNGSRSAFFKIPLSLSISGTRMVEDEDQRTYTEYIIDVKFNGGQNWRVTQRYKAFCSLHDSLLNQFPSFKFPETSFQFNQPQLDHGRQPDRGTPIHERVKNLERYLQDLALIPAIKESEQFKLFLSINQKCPEISENFRSSLIPKDFENNAIRPQSLDEISQNIMQIALNLRTLL